MVARWLVCLKADVTLAPPGEHGSIADVVVMINVTWNVILSFTGRVFLFLAHLFPYQIKSNFNFETHYYYA